MEFNKQSAGHGNRLVGWLLHGAFLKNEPACSGGWFQDARSTAMQNLAGSVPREFEDEPCLFSQLSPEPPLLGVVVGIVMVAH